MIVGYASSVNLPNIGTNTETIINNSGGNNGECRDYTGRAVMHSMHFVPPGVDMCKLCICENGHPKVRIFFLFLVVNFL
mgnify:CR=1